MTWAVGAGNYAQIAMVARLRVGATSSLLCRAVRHMRILQMDGTLFISCQKKEPELRPKPGMTDMQHARKANMSGRMMGRQRRDSGTKAMGSGRCLGSTPSGEIKQDLTYSQLR